MSDKKEMVTICTFTDDKFEELLSLLCDECKKIITEKYYEEIEREEGMFYSSEEIFDHIMNNKNNIKTEDFIMSKEEMDCLL